MLLKSVKSISILLKAVYKDLSLYLYNRLRINTF